MKIHFIGIGGIGMSALAQYMHALGHTISGSDMKASHHTEIFEHLGCAINIGHDAKAITGQDLVVYSAVVKPQNAERQEALAQRIRVLSRREFLPYVVQNKEVYAVCGAHGKSTTTAILASIMAGSALIGAQSKAFDSNMRFDATSNRLLFEADESDASFLQANAHVAIVTNAEPEHMEYYEHDTARFYDAYTQFLTQAPVRVINAEDPFLATFEGEAIRLYPSRDITHLQYTLRDDEPYTRFDFKTWGSFEVWGFGAHIALDAALAVLAAYHSGMPLEEIRTNLRTYRGIKKRFDILHKNAMVLIDDYGHHPTEIEATLSSTKAYAQLKGIEEIITIWQPHKYSRTLDNLEAFVRCFAQSTKLIILPVWSAGETHVAIDFASLFGGYNPLFADGIKREKDTIILLKDNKIISTLQSGLVIGFGAGDITYQLRGEV